MKKLVSMVMGLAAVAAFAAPMPEVQVLTFSVTGAETYADKSALEDGECYALVWSADGTFEGINADGTAKDAADKVVHIDQIEKDADICFQIADGNSGVFDIWILDTRVFKNGAVDLVGKDKDGKVTVSHAAKAIGAAVTVSGSSAPAAPTAVSGAEGGFIPTVAAKDIPHPKFTNIDPKKDGFVEMTLVDVVPGVRYVTMTIDDKEKSGEFTATDTTMKLFRDKKLGELIKCVAVEK